MTFLPSIQIISEEASETLSKPLRSLEEFLDEHGGDDLVRWLHAQEVEITAHTDGAIIKAYRNDAEYDKKHPEDNWRFFAGRYEIDMEEMSSEETEQLLQTRISKAPGFSHKDYFYPIQHIIKKHKNGALSKIPKRTLLVLQATGTKKDPQVRLYSRDPQGRFVVIGVKYQVTESWVQNVLRMNKPREIERMALEKQNHWEGHSQVQRMADILDTDSLPLLFRGRLATNERTVKGISKSANQDTMFKRILNNFFAKAPKKESGVRDYEALFRRTIQNMGDLEIKRINNQEKVQDSMVITQDSLAILRDHIFGRFDDVEANIQGTVSRFGPDSEQHRDDHRDLNYNRFWVRDAVGRVLFSSKTSDPITNAVVNLLENDQPANKTNVLKWVNRELTEEGIYDQIYTQHVSDENVPSGRQMGRNELFNEINRELERIIDKSLDEIVQRITITQNNMSNDVIDTEGEESDV